MTDLKQFYHIEYSDWLKIPPTLETKRFLVHVGFDPSHYHDKYVKYIDGLHFSVLVDVEQEDLTYLTLLNIKFYPEIRTEIVKSLNIAYLNRTQPVYNYLNGPKNPPICCLRGAITMKRCGYFPDTSFCIRIDYCDLTL